MKNVLIRVTPETRKKLKILAAEQGKTIGQVVTELARIGQAKEETNENHIVPARG